MNTSNTLDTADQLDWEGMRSLLWEPVRRARRVEDQVLLTDTLRWLAELPRGVRPKALPRRYARIANELSRLWADEQALTTYLGDLLVDRRGGRQGFPALVHEELQALQRFAQRQQVPAVSILTFPVLALAA